jgi:hypothetical protein
VQLLIEYPVRCSFLLDARCGAASYWIPGEVQLLIGYPVRCSFSLDTR